MRKLLVLFLFLTLVLIACGGGEGEGEGDTKEGSGSGHASEAGAGGEGGEQAKLPPLIAFVHSGLDDAWRKARIASFVEEVEKHVYRLKLVDCYRDPGLQRDNVRKLLPEKPKAIILSPVEEKKWDLVLRELQDHNIPVIVLDKKLSLKKPGLVATYVFSDYERQGRAAGEWLAKEMGGQAAIVELVGSSSSASSNGRAKGFRQALAKHAGMRIVASALVGGYSRTKASVEMESLIRRYPDRFNAVFVHNDRMAFGAIEALDSAGLDPGEKIKVVSVNGSREALDEIVAGRLNCSVECNPAFGPAVFGQIGNLLADHATSPTIYVHDTLFDFTNAREQANQRIY